MTFIAPGNLIGESIGNYRIVRLVGHGQLSAVYDARDMARDLPVQLIMFLIPRTLPIMARARLLARFQRECASLIQLKHPHILPITDFGRYVDFPYLVTPIVEGVSLAEKLRQQGRLTTAYTLNIVEQIASGIDYAHAHNVLHGALSPVNILLDSEGDVCIAGLGFQPLLSMDKVLQEGR